MSRTNAVVLNIYTPRCPSVTLWHLGRLLLLTIAQVQAIGAERTARSPGHCVLQLGDVTGHSVEPEPPTVPALARRPVAARPARPLGRHASQRWGGGEGGGRPGQQHHAVAGGAAVAGPARRPPRPHNAMRACEPLYPPKGTQGWVQAACM